MELFGENYFSLIEFFIHFLFKNVLTVIESYWNLNDKNVKKRQKILLQMYLEIYCKKTKLQIIWLIIITIYAAKCFR